MMPLPSLLFNEEEWLEYTVARKEIVSEMGYGKLRPSRWRGTVITVR